MITLIKLAGNLNNKTMELLVGPRIVTARWYTKVYFYNVPENVNKLMFSSSHATNFTQKSIVEKKIKHVFNRIEKVSWMEAFEM